MSWNVILLNSTNAGIRCFTRLISVVLCMLMLTACGTYTLFVEKSYEPIYLSLPEKPSYPIARELTYKYLDRTQIKENPMRTMVVADGSLIKTSEQFKNLTFYSTRSVTSGVKMSDVYQQRADEARQLGRTGDAAMNSQMAYSAAVQEQAFEQAQTGTNLAFASVNALAVAARALTEKWNVEAGDAVSQYIRETFGAVGEGAAENTTLEVVFNHIYRYRGKQEYPVAATMEFSATATLKDQNGKIWRSEANFKILSKEGDIKSNNVPPDMAEFIYLGPALIPPNTTHDSSLARQSYDALTKYAGDRNRVRELVMVSLAAIHGLYAQLEFGKK